MNYLLNTLEKKDLIQFLRLCSTILLKVIKKVNNNDKTFVIGVTIMGIYKRYPMGFQGRCSHTERVIVSLGTWILI